MSQQINLFNPIFLKQKKHFSAVTMLQALTLILIGAGLMTAYAGMQLAKLRPEADAVTAQLEAARAQLAVVTATHGVRQKDALLDAEVRRAEAESVALQRVSQILIQGELGGLPGYSDYMKAFSRQIVDGLWLTEFSIRGGGAEIAMAGRALRPELVPAYLNRLSREPTMRGRSFGAMEIYAPREQATATPPSIVFTLQSTERDREMTAAEGAEPR